MKKERRWRIVGFKHPQEERSIIYQQDLTDAQLIASIERGIRHGCNLFSIRGFEK